VSREIVLKDLQCGSGSDCRAIQMAAGTTLWQYVLCVAAQARNVFWSTVTASKALHEVSHGSCPKRARTALLR
jgi:hypothetical protein